MSEVKDEFLLTLEKAVTDVLANKKSTATQKMQAATVGLKLLQIKHKVPEDKTGSFFK